MRNLTLAAVGLLLVAAFLVGCGGGGSSSGATGATDTGSTTAGSTESTSTEESNSTEESTSTSPSSTTTQQETRTSPPAPGFSKKGKPVAFGYEASATEREQASQILEKSLKARAGRDYATQCKTLSKAIIEAIEKSRYHLNCTQTLKIEDLLTPPAKTANTMQGPIAALRVQGTVAYALYHGKGGNDYAMRMELEDGEWKVAEVLTEKLP